MIHIHLYQSADETPLLTIFRKNVPAAFGESEVADYADFLRVNPDPYFVAEHNGQLVGACGCGVKEDGITGRIAWIFTDPDFAGVGVGSALVRHCLGELRANPAVTLIECRTSQVAYRFFEHLGFVLQRTELDYWVPGFDLYVMTLKP
ncbi:MAG: GNAT family N-acetyltransferase [Spirosoma sp.]|nr:GNAT family N-acetyltransferase [Spirosoma sp.]